MKLVRYIFLVPVFLLSSGLRADLVQWWWESVWPLGAVPV